MSATLHTHADDHDFSALATTPVVWLALASLGVGGLCTVLTGLQTVTSIRLDGLWEAMPFAQLGLGALAILIAFIVGRMRLWATHVGLVVSVLLTIVNGAWSIFSVGGGVFSLIALMAAGASCVSVPFVALSIAPCRRATEARERLRKDGLDPGF